jgi:hypothetical protein
MIEIFKQIDSFMTPLDFRIDFGGFQKEVIETTAIGAQNILKTD